MAKRQTLQELQARLAERLQSVQAENGAGLQWLAVRAAERYYLVPLAQAGEIFPWQPPKAVPYTQPWYWGVANLRGSLTGVADLAHLLGHPVTRTEQRLTQASLISIHPVLEVNACIVVDQLLGLRGEKDFVRVVPGDDAHHAHLGEVYEDGEGVRWQMLRLQSLVQSPDFLNVRL